MREQFRSDSSISLKFIIGITIVISAKLSYIILLSYKIHSISISVKRKKHILTVL